MCLASRWPEAVPRAISEAILPVFSKIGLPLEMLSNQGSQFTGKLAKEVCKLLQIKQVGIDWVEQLPFALFAIKQMPCRSTGFSPLELNYGSNVRTRLDLFYEGWRNEDKGGLDVRSWVRHLVEWLDAMWDYAVARSLKEIDQRKLFYDKGKIDRKLEVGQLVM